MSKPYENPTEMKEMKPSLFALTAWWLSRHLILVGVIVAFILSLVGCDKAKAAEDPEDYPVGGIPQYVQDYIVDTYFSTTADAQKQEIYDAFANSSQFLFEQFADGNINLVCLVKYGTYVYMPGCANFGGGETNSGAGGDLSVPDGHYNYTFDYDTLNPVASSGSTSDNYGYASQYYTYSTSERMAYTFYVYNHSFYSNGWRANYLKSNQQPYAYNYYARWYSNQNFNPSYATGEGIVIAYGDVNCFHAPNSTFWPQYKARVMSNWENVVPSYSDDSRLKFAKINSTYDGEVLMTDIRDFVKGFIIQDTSHSSVYLDPESITLKYTVDGTEKTITLDSSNSTIRSKYIFETPIFEFDFDDDNTSVIITKADFTISGTSQSAPYEASQSYKISCNYPIRQLAPLPTPTPIPDPTYNDVTTDVSDPATVLTEITTQLVNNSTTTNAFTGEWTLDQEHPTVPSWADNYDFRVIKSDFNSIISGVVNKDIWNYYTSNDPDDYDWITGGFNPRNFVDENRNFAFYDMIIISVYEATIAWDTTSQTPDLIYQDIHLLGYITLYSQRYYVHKSAITDSNILATLEYASMNDVAFYETVKAQIDQFEEYTLGRLDAQLDIEKDSLAWLKTISSKIDDIEPYDDTSLLGKLDTIIEKLTQLGNRSDNEDDTVAEAIAYYRAHNDDGNPTAQVFTDNKMSIWLAGKVHDWLQGTFNADPKKERIAILSKTFDVLTNMYGAMEDETFFFSSLFEFLTDMSGSGDVESPDDDYLTFFFSNSFDPDTYEGVTND